MLTIQLLIVISVLVIGIRIGGIEGTHQYIIRYPSKGDRNGGALRNPENEGYAPCAEVHRVYSFGGWILRCMAGQQSHFRHSPIDERLHFDPR